MRLARTASPLPRNEQVWPAGVEPAISGAQNRRGGHLPHSQVLGPRTRPWRRPGSRRPWNRTTLHRRIRAALAQPARRRCLPAQIGIRLRGLPIAQIPEAGRFAAGSPLQHGIPWGVARESHPAPRIHSPRARYKPCDADSPGGVEPPSPTVGAWRSSTELRREALSTGIEPASPGRQPGRMSQTRPRAWSTPSGTRTRVSGVRDRRPRPSRRSGHEAATAGVEPASPG